MADNAKDMMAKFNEGDRVVVPYGREMVRGKIVRYDAPSMAYVVDIGKYESVKVAQEDVRKASFARPGAPDTFAEDIGLTHALAIARKTIRYNAAILGVMGGMTKKQAYELLLKHGTPKEKSEAADYLRQFSRPGTPARFAVEDRFYFGKSRKERFASISMPRQSVTSGASGTWKKREVTVRGKKAWLVELHRGSVLVGYLNQHPDTRQFHAFDGNTDRQIGVGSESEMKRLVESL